MRVITTLSPRRIDRQKKCINTWINHGCEVTAVQESTEADHIASLFPSVSVVPTDKTATRFGKPTFVRVSALLEQCSKQPGLIINSDIEMTGGADVVHRHWEAEELMTLKCGVRSDYNQVLKRPKVFKWGIDAFWVTPEIAENIDDIGLAVGIPCWDYWLPMHFHLLGWKISTSWSPALLHENHKQRWSNADSRIGYEILFQRYKMKECEIVPLIQKITGREHIR